VPNIVQCVVIVSIQWIIIVDSFIIALDPKIGRVLLNLICFLLID